MGDGLPVNWRMTTIGEVTLPVEKIDPAKKANQEFIYLDISGIDNKSNKIVEVKRYLGKEAPSRARQLVQVNDVLFSTVRTYLRNIAVVPAQYDGQVASTGFSVLRAVNGISGNFLFYFSLTNGFLVPLAELQRGSSYPAVRDIDVRVQQIPLPPLNEQKRIVDKIEQLFSNIDEGESLLKKVQQQLNLYRQSVLKSAVTGELTKDWREANKHRLESGDILLKRILKSRREQWNGRGKYKEPAVLDTSNLPALPFGWVWVSVEQILIEGLSNGRSVPDAADGFPVLRLTALNKGIIDICKTKIGAWSPEDAAPFVIKFEDFLVSRGNGSKHLVGRGGLVSIEPDPVAYPDTLIRIRTTRCHVDKRFFSYVWNSYFVRQQIETKAKTTAGIYKINQGDICSFLLPLPSVDEQGEMVNKIDEIFSQIDALEQWCASELIRSATLRQSILKDAFTGKLVPQDPADEPASELLKLISSSQLTPSTGNPKKREKIANG